MKKTGAGFVDISGAPAELHVSTTGIHPRVHDQPKTGFPLDLQPQRGDMLIARGFIPVTMPTQQSGFVFDFWAPEGTPPLPQFIPPILMITFTLLFSIKFNAIIPPLLRDINPERYGTHSHSPLYPPKKTENQKPLP